MNELNMKKGDIAKLHSKDYAPPAEVTSSLDFSMRIAEINTGRVKTAEELSERFDKLFQIATEMGKIPRYEHLSLVSGIPKRTLYDYGNDDYNGGMSPVFSPIIKKAKLIIASAESELALTGKIPSVVYIFRAKNYEGLKDVQEIKATPVYNTDPTNAEEIVAALPDVDSEKFVEIKTN